MQRNKCFKCEYKAPVIALYGTKKVLFPGLLNTYCQFRICSRLRAGYSCKDSRWSHQYYRALKGSLHRCQSYLVDLNPTCIQLQKTHLNAHTHVRNKIHVQHWCNKLKVVVIAFVVAAGAVCTSLLLFLVLLFNLLWLI